MKYQRLLSAIFLFAQLSYSPNNLSQTYSLKISSPEDERPMGSIVDQNNELDVLIWRGEYKPDINTTTYFFDYRNIIYHIDDQGSIVDSLEVDNIGDYDLSLWDFIRIGDSLLVWGNAYNLESETVHLVLLWLNFDLQVIDQHFYGSYCDSVQFIHCTIVNDSNMVFAGFHFGTLKLILVKTNKSGELIEENAIPYWGGPFPNVCYLPSTDQIICGRYTWIGYINNYDLTEDTLYFPPIFDQFFSFSFFKPLDSSHCILPGQILKTYPAIGWNVACLVFDTIAQITDSVIFDLPYETNNAIEVDYITTDSIFFGAIENSQVISPYPNEFAPIDRWFALYKFNFNGDRFWEKYYGGDGNYNLHGITVMLDGGCALLGAFYDWRNNPIWERDVVIYKVDSKGLLTNLPEISKDFVHIFPNPASDKIIIKFSEEETHKINKKIVQVFDILGNRLFSKFGIADNEIIINVSDFPSGIYIVRIITDKNFHIIQKVVVD